MTIELLMMLLTFQVKHLIADYYLQFPYMYENKGKATGWVGPLFNHSLVHGVLTYIIVAIFTSNVGLAMLALLIDAVTHFWIDRWKATRPDKVTESGFWTNLGIDQMLHHVVGILIILVVL